MEDQVDIRSYKVRTEDGRLHRRNRRHPRQSKEPFGQASETSLVCAPQDNPSNIAPAAAEPIGPKLTGQPAQNNVAGQPTPRQEPPSGLVNPTVVTRSGRAPHYLQGFVTVR